MSTVGHLLNRATFRRLTLVLAASLVSAAAVAAPLMMNSQATQTEQDEPASPTAEAFASALVTAINNALATNAGVTDLVALQGLLEEAIEAVFLNSNVTPEAALAGVEQARAALQATGALCAVPEGPATERCEAVALAFQLAERAAAAAQTDPTGAVGTAGDSSGAALGPPPSAGSGGGGGGVTHPPVTL